MFLFNFRIILFFLLVFFILLLDCRKKESTNTKEQILSFLLNQSLTQSSDPCVSFVTSENLCLLNPTNTLQICSDSEKNRLKKNIEPQEKQTNEVLNAFYECWKNCNLLFNSQEPICAGSKFTNAEIYRNAQKSGQSASSKSWILCMTRCNQGEAEETKLYNATFKGWAY